MKKLLSALFILGSVAALAQETLDRPGGGEGNPPNCYTNACKVDKDMTISVQVPTQLEITCLENIDLGKWCGTKTKTEDASYHLRGEKGAIVKVYFENSAVQFKKGGNDAGFYAYMDVDGVAVSSKTLSSSSGTNSGKVNATLYPLEQGIKLQAKGNYTATAKLIAEYDSF